MKHTPTPMPKPSCYGPLAAEYPEVDEGVSQRKKRGIDWATLLQKTFNLDVFECPCGGKRRVLDVISNAKSAVRMLKALQLPYSRPVFARARPPPAGQLSFVPVHDF